MRTYPVLLAAFILLAAPAGATPPPIVPYGSDPPPLLQAHPPAVAPLPAASRTAFATPAAPSMPYVPQATLEPALFAGMLAGHNRARAALGEPPLLWSPSLAATAQSWAQHLRAEQCNMRHSRASGLGENLAWAAQQHLSPATVVKLWVDEAASYNRAANDCAAGAMCGHYTQVVWRTTREVGCGYASCGGSEIWVCNYAPAGNVVGDRPY
jgi:pathogenesis-related protein 1